MGNIERQYRRPKSIIGRSKQSSDYDVCIDLDAATEDYEAAKVQLRGTKEMLMRAQVQIAELLKKLAEATGAGRYL